MLTTRRVRKIFFTSNGSVSVRLCLSVTSRCSIEVVGRIELVFGTEASDRACAQLALERAAVEPAGDDRVARIQRLGLVLCTADFRVHFDDVEHRQFACSDHTHMRARKHDIRVQSNAEFTSPTRQDGPVSSRRSVETEKY